MKKLISKILLLMFMACSFNLAFADGHGAEEKKEKKE